MARPTDGAKTTFDEKKRRGWMKTKAYEQPRDEESHSSNPQTIRTIQP
jgi:hypothetical protein